MHFCDFHPNSATKESAWGECIDQTICIITGSVDLVFVRVHVHDCIIDNNGVNNCIWKGSFM